MRDLSIMMQNVQYWNVDNLLAKAPPPSTPPPPQKKNSLHSSKNGQIHSLGWQ